MSSTKNNPSSPRQYYLTIWRWHFYAGVFVTPFLILLAVTGLAMMLLANIYGKDREKTLVTIHNQVQPLSVQAQTALDAVDKDFGMIVQYMAPKTAQNVAVFRVQDKQGNSTMVTIDPYTAEVVETFPRAKDMYHFMDDLHSDILLGTWGDFLLETAAALTILLILTGWYLWWCANQKSIGRMLWSLHWHSGRSVWRHIHGVLGSWISILLILFCISGMAWAGIWGGKLVQAWSQFPAGKWGVPPSPESVLLHGDLNDGNHKEIPWVLELTPMPVSGSVLGQNGIADDIPVTLDSIDRFAREIGFVGRYHIFFPKGETGVWTLNQDSMSYDSPNPTADRTVHIDRYSGKILADIQFKDYNWFGQFMAASIALHVGTMGWWSVGLNTVFCLAVILLCISGWVMWWKRRPSKVFGLVSPTYQMANPPTWKGAAVFLMLIALIFPTAFITILIVYLLDKWLISKIPCLSHWFK